MSRPVRLHGVSSVDVQYRIKSLRAIQSLLGVLAFFLTGFGFADWGVLAHVLDDRVAEFAAF